VNRGVKHLPGLFCKVCPQFVPASPPAANRRAQQRAFDAFQREYNEVRPHQALAMRTPAAVYQPSPRAYPMRTPQPEYASGMLVRRVRQGGVISWKMRNLFLSEVLEGEAVGLLPLDDRWYRIYFAAFPIARFDSQRRRIERLRPEDRGRES
jgi:hypothetical protein